jgi:hypothetical protein
MGTKPPYYANIAVAAMLSQSKASNVSVSHVPLLPYNERQAAYAAYVDNRLARILALNLVAHNYTLNGTGGATLNPDPRPISVFGFQVPPGLARSAHVQKLVANGSDAITGITFDGWSYNHELAEGRPVRLGNVTLGERIEVTSEGRILIEVPASQAVLLTLSTEELPGSRCGAK